MTIREAGKEKVLEGSGRHDYRIGFNGDDETEVSAESMDELESLWKSLCPEFECEENSADYVERA